MHKTLHPERAITSADSQHAVSTRMFRSQAHRSDNARRWQIRYSVDSGKIRPSRFNACLSTALYRRR